jgi:hypothetical protein
MLYAQLAHGAQIYLVAWLGLLAVIIAYRGLVSGQGVAMLSARPGAGIDAERVQMLVTVIGGAGYYAAEALKTIGEGAPVTALPEAPQTLVTLIAVSQGLYLAGKLNRPA